jgi:uncharacterized protein
MERQFLVEEGFEDQILHRFQPQDHGIWEMWLIVVQSCNLACQYCVVEGNVSDPRRRSPFKILDGSRTNPNASRDVMTPEVAAAAVDVYAKLIQKSRPAFPRVTFYGGEPLLNREVIEHTVPLLRKIQYPGQPREKPVHILVITNGQIYRPELTEFFKEHRVTVSVSLDGKKEHHDAARVNRNGDGSFEQAAASLRRYTAAGINTGICTTIGTHNYKHLPEIADYFGDEFGVPVEFQVPFNIPFEGGNQYYLKMSDAAPFAMEAFARLRRRGLIEGLATRRLMQVAGGVFHHRDCSAVGGQIVVSPDGMLGPCHSLVGERKFFDGDVRDAQCDPAAMPAFQEWWGRQPIRMKECHGCPAIGICGGGCPYNAMIETGSIWHKDPQQCDYMDYMLDWILDDVWQRHRTTHRPQIQGPLFAHAFQSGHAAPMRA